MSRTTLNNTALLIIGFVLLWNSGFIGAAFGLDYADPLTLLFWRYWVLAALLAIYLGARRQLYWPGLRTAGIDATVGICAHGAWLAAVMFALQAGVPAGIVALVIALQPVTVGALAGLVTGEATSPARWLGLAVGFAGVLVAVLARIEPGNLSSLLAYLLPFGAVIAFTVASLLQRWVEVRSPTDQLPVELALFYQCLATALIVTLPAIVFEGLVTRWTPAFVAIMAWLIFAVSLAAYDLMWRLIGRMDATRVASLFYLGPPVTMLMAWIFLGETLRTTDIAGLLITAIGVLIVHRSASVPSAGQRS
ncbi:MAG: DMT family transporter [Gammaproteobacteria bacterium]